MTPPDPPPRCAGGAEGWRSPPGECALGGWPNRFSYATSYTTLVAGQEAARRRSQYALACPMAPFAGLSAVPVQLSASTVARTYNSALFRAG
ncbi:hypothetical protein ACF08M_13225 [Streptomyces sp. NPDC015032]|uniref:hypothetical protein n=1 Tax=Streptomyces sp. NPDC015032 TaxID=3364937 RepID=UPI00370095F6